MLQFFPRFFITLFFQFLPENMFFFQSMHKKATVQKDDSNLIVPFHMDKQIFWVWLRWKNGQEKFFYEQLKVPSKDIERRR